MLANDCLTVSNLLISICCISDYILFIVGLIYIEQATSSSY